MSQERGQQFAQIIRKKKKVRVNAVFVWYFEMWVACYESLPQFPKFKGLRLRTETILQIPFNFEGGKPTPHPQEVNLTKRTARFFY